MLNTLYKILIFILKLWRDLVSSKKEKEQKEKDKELENAINNGTITDIENALRKK